MTRLSRSLPSSGTRLDFRYQVALVRDIAYFLLLSRWLFYLQAAEGKVLLLLCKAFAIASDVIHTPRDTFAHLKMESRMTKVF